MLFPDGGRRTQRKNGVRVVVTGQVGLDKSDFLQQVVDIARTNGKHVELINVGERMYQEAPDVAKGRILDLPRQRLASLRRSVFKDILATAASGANVIINTHATFRWKHGLFLAYDHNQMVDFDPDFFITLVDNVDAVHERLTREHEIAHTLKDILVWREEELVVTEAMAEAVAGYGRAFVVSRGQPAITARSVYRLMFEPHRKRVYPSFPMTHVLGMPNVMAEIQAFRHSLAEYFITFDPEDIDEKRLLAEASEATERGKKEITVHVHGQELVLDVNDVTSIAGDIDGQIYARDFKQIDQADMIVSYIPELSDGRPSLSSGVERELQHAFEGTKEVYVVWRPKREPSPFITETATCIFESVEAFLTFCQTKGYIKDFQLPLK